MGALAAMRPARASTVVSSSVVRHDLLHEPVPACLRGVDEVAR